MYLASYRKFRPKTFDEVIGQNHITQTLRNQIINGQISHAYLFCGTRGTGKTSVAKVFAQSINCENPQNGSACQKCATCVALMEQNSLDILEIDAASNNRVDEIRELREKVKYPPVNGKYKVYIIDEVHMLTDSAFNALLKTLEEPPKHVVFILATTEVQKLPATILSRCLRFDFKLVSLQELKQHVEYVFTKEGVKFEPEAVQLIASLGEGSVRDTLSVADMVVAFSNKNVTYKAVLDAVGAIDKNVLFTLGENILSKNAQVVLETINQIVLLGKSVVQIAKDLSLYFRDLAVIKTTKEYSQILNYPKNLLESLERVSKEYEISQILEALKAFSSLENEFRNVQNPRVVLEVTALNLIAGSVSSELEKKIVELENQLKNSEKKTKSTANIESVSPQLVKVVELFDNDYQAPTKPLKKEVELHVNDTIKPKQEDLKPISEEVLSGVFESKDVKINTNSNAKSLFGKLLINLRQNNEVILHSMLGTNVNAEIRNNEFTIVVSDKSRYTLLKKQQNQEILNTLIQKHDPSLILNVVFEEAQNSVKESVLSKLIDLFGNKLIVE